MVNIPGAPLSFTSIQTNLNNLDIPAKYKIRSREMPSICLTFPKNFMEPNDNIT